MANLHGLAKGLPRGGFEARHQMLAHERVCAETATIAGCTFAAHTLRAVIVTGIERTFKLASRHYLEVQFSPSPFKSSP